MHDRLYGTINITEPVILDIIKSNTFQRLKGIDQAGYFDVYLPGTKHTRYEHSIGVYLLLKKYNAPLYEQIAGLIHDVSHSAFSHCIDYVEGKENQKTHLFQDSVFETFVHKSDIPNILQKYSIPIDYLLDEKHFPLKETNLPDLCADRIDYSLRTAVIYHKTPNSDIQYFLRHLTATKTQWIFDSYKSAKKYADLFRLLNKKYYSGLSSVSMFYTVGNFIRYALEKKYITWKELYTTDSHVLQIINAHRNNDKTLQQLWKRMNNKIPVIHDEKNYEDIVYCKSRIVDPLFTDHGIIKRVSEKNAAWKKIIQEESQPKKYFLRFS